jgi:hypothetical protein
MAQASQEALGTRGWRAGVRARGVAEIRSGVGGVARQWCGRLGQVANCQVAIYSGYVSRQGQTRVAQRLLLPTAWPKEKARLDKAGVPKAYRAYRTRPQVAWELWTQPGAGRPHSWRAGDDEMGRPDWLRRRLAAVGARDLWAVPAHTARRALETAPPESSGRGRPSQRPWHRVETWRQALGEAAWQRLDVRDGRQGPWVVEAVKRRVVARTHRRQQGEEETWVGRRSRHRDQPEGGQVDYSRSKAVPETPLGEGARVAKAAQRMEECLQRSQSAAGLAASAGRPWRGWQQQQTLS